MIYLIWHLPSNLNNYLHISGSVRFRRWRRCISHLLLFLLLLFILYLLHGAAESHMAAFVMFVLPPFLAALLPAALGGQLGKRAVDVVRGVTVVCRDSQSEGSPDACLTRRPGRTHTRCPPHGSCAVARRAPRQQGWGSAGSAGHPKPCSGHHRLPRHGV